MLIHLPTNSQLLIQQKNFGSSTPIAHLPRPRCPSGVCICKSWPGLAPTGTLTIMEPFCATLGEMLPN